jgi:imidazoleglycerol-phosphate dehydratase / histidinol-phosphatase
MKKILFIDRDGTIIKEAPPTYQVDSFDKLEFYPGVFYWLRKIAALDFDLVMVSNQDGLGTESYPEETFKQIQQFVTRALENENIIFKNIHIDRSFASDQLITRKPGTGMLTAYLNDPAYDIPGSFVIGDRITDVQLAKNLGCKAIWLKNEENLGLSELGTDTGSFDTCLALETTDWKDIYEFLQASQRVVIHERNTNETKIRITLNPDGNGNTGIDTGLSFFNHMLEQLSKHSGINLAIETKGDLHIDEHHTIEDTAIALGEAFAKALGDKKGIGRYGFSLPMDDCLAQVAIDFGGRPWLVWDAQFTREKIGDMPTEMFYHFFKSFSDAARLNMNIKAEGTNEHHKIESIFKAVARAIRMAIKKDFDDQSLPTTKGSL